MQAETYPQNQWSADILKSALNEQVLFEVGRRIMLRQTAGSRLATSPRAVERDVLRFWLMHALPGGNC